MFLCRNCVEKQEGGKLALLKFDIRMLSWGTCEDCGKVGGCLDWKEYKKEKYAK